MRQILDVITAPPEDFDFVVLDKTTRLATGEIVCDLIHPHTRIPKEPGGDKEDRLEAHREVWRRPYMPILYKEMRKDTCTQPELRSWIHSLVLGWLSVRKAKRLERHISACPACQIEKEFFLICKKLPTDRLYKLTYIREI